ncbi:MAG: ABC transporter substrate-binding protein [Candidatus Edwardsbacteria bacterium]
MPSKNIVVEVVEIPSLKILVESLTPLFLQIENFLKTREESDRELRFIYEEGVNQSEILEHIGRNLENLFADLEVVSEACELVASQAQEYKLKLTEGEKEISIVLKILSQVNQNITETNEKCQDLEKAAEGIEQIAEIILRLSRTTQGVARNAEIKAFHAGIKGRGFAVIAKQMSEMSERALSGTGEVSALLEDIHQDKRGFLEMMQKLLQKVKETETTSIQIHKRLTAITSWDRLSLGLFEEIRQSAEKEKTARGEVLALKEKLLTLSGETVLAAERAGFLGSGEKTLSTRLNWLRQNLKEMQKIWLEEYEQTSKKNLGLASRNLRREFAHFYFELGENFASMKEIADMMGSHNREDVGAIRSTNPDGFSEREPGTGELPLLNDFLAKIQQFSQKAEVIEQITKKLSQSLLEAQKESEGMTLDLQKALGLIDLLNQIEKEIIKRIKEMKESSSRLGQISKGIEEMSRESRLLSFYAAVEAASAGEFRESLSLIANEAKELINRSTEATSKILPLLETMGLSLQQVEEKVQTSQKMAEQNMQTLLATGEIFAQIRQRLTQSLDLVREINSAVERQKETQGILRQEGEDLLSHIQIFTQRKNNLTNEIRRNAALISEVKETGSQLQENLAELKELEEKFPFAKVIYKLDLPSNPLTLDPCFSGDANSHAVIANFSLNLVEFGESSELIPRLAERWSISDNGLVFRFQLRQGVKFHNGKEVKAEDVKASLEKALNPKFGAPNYFFFNIIAGAEEYLAGKAKEVWGIKIIDDYNVEIRLVKSYLPFLANLACGPGGIVPEEETKKSPSEFSLHPVGAGPFKFKEYVPNERLVLEANRDFFTGPPMIDEIHFLIVEEKEKSRTLFKEGKIHHTEPTGSFLEELRRDSKYNRHLFPLAKLDTQYLCINVVKSGPFVNKLVRQAMNYIINKEEIIGQSMKGEASPAKGILPPGIIGYNPELKGYPYDPEKAKRLLAEAGFPKGLPGEYVLDVTSNRLERAEIIKKNLAEVGIRIKLNVISWKELIDKGDAGESLLSMKGWSSDNGDPDNFFYPLFHSRSHGSSGNTSFYSNAEVDRLMVEAMAVKNPHARIKIYQRIEEIIVEEAPWVFLSHGIDHLARQPYAHGYLLHPLGIVRLKDCWLEHD